MSNLRTKLASFLETAPLFQKLTFADEPFADDFPSGVSLHLRCSKCASDQTFMHHGETRGHDLQRRTMSSFGGIATPTSIATIRGDVIEVQFVCAGCKAFERYYFLEIHSEGAWIRKVGQVPPWTINPDRELEDLLGIHADAYKRGLICESQGFGIGAFAYYRRVIEDLTEELLLAIEQLVQGTERAEYHEALEKAKSANKASDKFAFVKDYLPSILKPGNADPLGRIFGRLSEGLHSLPDDQCLEFAFDIRTCLEFVVRQVVGNKKATAAFTAALTRMESNNPPRPTRAE